MKPAQIKTSPRSAGQTIAIRVPVDICALIRDEAERDCIPMATVTRRIVLRHYAAQQSKNTPSVTA